MNNRKMLYDMIFLIFKIKKSSVIYLYILIILEMKCDVVNV